MNIVACDQCGSRDFFVEAGNTYCENGHDQNAGPEIRSDDEDYGTQGRRIQTKEKKPTQKISRIYHGARAYHLFLQAYQYILWKQCYALIHEQGLPAELWTVVRDLWGLRLSKLLHRIEDPTAEQVSDGDGISSGQDSEIESAGASGTRSKKVTGGSPSLIDTICLCYAAILLMRLPISLAQVLRWIHEEDVPYFRAIRHVPADMRDKLPGEYHEALNTSTILRPEMLQTGVSNICALYNRLYGMGIAPLNSTLMLYQYVKKLSLPLEVYAAANRLNEIVQYEFRYSYARSKRRQANSYPEAQLMSLVVIATKLLYPFDQGDFQYHPRYIFEPTSTSIDWKAWASGRRHAGEPVEALRVGNEIGIKDTEVFDMSSRQLDQYMDWYQLTWVRTDPVKESDVKKELLDMFPVKPVSTTPFDLSIALQEEKAQLVRAQQVQAKLRTNEIITDDEVEEGAGIIIRPGQRYQQFRDQDALTLQPIADAFHSEAAELSCLPTTMLLRAVLQTERKITLWQRAKRRAKRFGEEKAATFGTLPLGLEGLDQMTLAEDIMDGEATTSAAHFQEDDERSSSAESIMQMIE